MQYLIVGDYILMNLEIIVFVLWKNMQPNQIWEERIKKFA